MSKVKLGWGRKEWCSQLFQGGNLVLLFSVMGAGAAIFFLRDLREFSDVKLFGIAEGQEQNISFDYSVEVDKIHVTPGQLVKKGDLLLELGHVRIDQKIRQVKYELAKMRADYKIRDRLANLISSQENIKDGSSDLKNSGNIKNDLSFEFDLQELEKEQARLENQRKMLNITAPSDGRIGSINFRPGDKVSPFNSLVSILPSSITVIDGFVLEDFQDEIRVNQEVRVLSAFSSKAVIGKIVQKGSSVQIMPEKFRANAYDYGRGMEVKIQISPTEAFLPGEKIQVQTESQFKLERLNLIAHAMAGGEAPEEGPFDLNAPFNGIIDGSTAFEPSGVAYLPALRKFVVASDDTDKNKKAEVTLLSPNGTMDASWKPLIGLDRFEDIESASVDEKGNLYLLGSNMKKEGKFSSDARQYFYRVEVSKDESFRLTGKVLFRPLLISALSGNANPVIAEVADRLERQLQIEAFAVREKRMFIALKRPLTVAGDSLILMISNYDRVFQTGRLAAEDVSVWKTIQFPSENKEGAHITDMAFVGENLFLTTTGLSGATYGNLWKYSILEGKIESKRRFEGIKPEGVSFDPINRRLIVVFDNGELPASIFTCSEKKCM